MSFEQIIGNEKIKQELKNYAYQNKASHSYLFVGQEGIGKKLFATEFAKILLCENAEEVEPCDSCIKFQSNNHPDFEIIESDGKSVKIEQIRNLQEGISQKPIVSKRKIYIIDDSDKMTKEAQNALLKTLEEPPEYAIIILVASNESKLLATIKSRCMKIAFQPLGKEEMKTYLRKAGIEEKNANLLNLYNGSIGKAIRLQEKREIYEQIENVIESLEKQDIVEVFKKAEVLYKEKEIVQELLEYCNILLFQKALQNSIYLPTIKIVEETKRRMGANANHDMSIDNMLLTIWEEIH